MCSPAAGCRLRHGAAGSADDDAELALVDHPTVIGSRPPDCLANCQERGGRLEEEERLLRRRELELAGKRMEVIPQRHHLARHVGRQHRDGRKRQGLAGRRGFGEEGAPSVMVSSSSVPKPVRLPSSKRIQRAMAASLTVDLAVVPPGTDSASWRAPLQPRGPRRQDEARLCAYQRPRTA
jgi:hypothetical protein